MPTYVSNNGKWVPAMEKSVGILNKETGETSIYSGPCREAVKELAQQGVEFLGDDYRNDPEFLEMIRARKYESIDEYLRVKGITKDKEKETFKKNFEETVAHKKPAKKKNIVVTGGGVDTSGQGNDSYAKIGTPPPLN